MRAALFSPESRYVLPARAVPEEEANTWSAFRAYLRRRVAASPSRDAQSARAELMAEVIYCSRCSKRNPRGANLSAERSVGVPRRDTARRDDEATPEIRFMWLRHIFLDDRFRSHIICRDPFFSRRNRPSGERALSRAAYAGSLEHANRKRMAMVPTGPPESDSITSSLLH